MVKERALDFLYIRYGHSGATDQSPHVLNTSTWIFLKMQRFCQGDQFYEFYTWEHPRFYSHVLTLIYRSQGVFQNCTRVFKNNTNMIFIFFFFLLCLHLHWWGKRKDGPKCLSPGTNQGITSNYCLLSSHALPAKVKMPLSLKTLLDEDIKTN